jgi:hypothetical protein
VADAKSMHAATNALHRDVSSRGNASHERPARQHKKARPRVIATPLRKGTKKSHTARKIR